MSTNAPRADSIAAARSEALSQETRLGARENYWGEDLSSDTSDHEDPDRDYGHAHRFKPPQNRNALLAHKLLRDSATMYCAETLYGDPDDPWALHSENEAVELTDPEHHVPKGASSTFGSAEAGQYRHRARVNEEAGYLSGPEGTTSVVIADRPTDEFLDVVESAIRVFDPRPSVECEVRDRAGALKAAGEMRDVDVMERVVGWLREPGALEDSA